MLVPGTPGLFVTLGGNTLYGTDLVDAYPMPLSQPTELDIGKGEFYCIKNMSWIPKYNASCDEQT